MIPVVAFTGWIGCGKTTAAKLLTARGYMLIKFAEPLKDMIRSLGVEEEYIEGARKNEPHPLLCGRTARHAMQTLGTEWGRNLIGEEFWVNAWKERASKWLGHGGLVVVDDCRFPNEAQAVKALGGKVILLTRRGSVSSSHPSEASVAEIEHNYWVLNNESIYELNATLASILEEE